jgi:predicted 3-demethylubiquinone-9 3-methyltransferase (glyoxalase superfamily)
MVGHHPGDPTMSLPIALQTCDMLLIDTLHAFDFSFDEEQTLHIQCMDGRELKRWQFTLQEQQAAQPGAESHSYVISQAGVSHQLTCLSAFSARDEEDETQA